MWTGWLAAGRPVARWMGSAVYMTGLGAALRGDDDADEWLRRADLVLGEDLFGRQSIPARRSAVLTFVLARRDLHDGHYAEAAERTRAFEANVGDWYREDSRSWYDAYAWGLDAELAVLTGAADVRERLAAAQPAAKENRWAAACLDRARGRLDHDAVLLERSIVKWEQIEARFERACTLLLLPEREEEGRVELGAIGATSPR
jgi:hypothetical protein